MIPHHVFVETNWVVAIVAPALAYEEGAHELLQRCRRGELTLHVPAIALAEAHKVVRDRTLRINPNAILNFVRTQQAVGALDDVSAHAIRAVMPQFKAQSSLEREQASARIAALRSEPIDIFALDEQMLTRSLHIAAETDLALQSFDLAVLAAVLVRGEALYTTGSRVSLCELDRDLQPWGKRSAPKPELAALYEAAGVWVYGDFLLAEPARPEAWPRRGA